MRFGDPKEILPALKRYKKLKLLVEQQQKEMDEIKSACGQYLELRGMKELSTGGFKVMRMKVPVDRIDVRRLREEQPELADDYLVTDIHDRIIIK